jgi:two-component system, sensor histidine kinase and response regulator
MDPVTRPLRVLLIDDDSALLDAMSQMLALRFPSIEVDKFDNAFAALRSVSFEDYDAIVSDIKMPGIDGLELLAKVTDASPEVPVLLITGHGETDLAIRALRAQAFDLIQKPIERDYLVAALTRAFELRSLRREVRAKQAALERHAEELERRVEERTAELREANRTKDEFLGLVSHELRTPLTVIVGSVDLLNRHKDTLTPEETAQLNLDLRLQSRRLQRIIENLLVLARAEIGAMAKTEPVSLTAVIEGQVKAHRRFYPEREILVRLSEHSTVQSDSTYLELVLGNLISNAEKYSDDPSPIEIVSARDGDDIVVSVLDRGRGLTPEEATLVFEPFYRTETSSKVPGAGIGLTVCRRLIEAQGGSICASPREGGGSNFSFRLPLAQTSFRTAVAV